MQFEMAGPSCPLCKRQLPASSAECTLDTRLCAQCQTQVLTAFRGADSMAVSSLAAVQQSGAVAQVQLDAPAPDYAVVGSSVFRNDIAPVGPSFEDDSPHSTPFEVNDELRFDLFQDEDPEDNLHRAKADLSVVAETGSSPQAEEFADGLVQSSALAEPEQDHEYSEPDYAHLAEEPAVIHSTLDAASTGVSPVEDRSEETPAIDEQPVTDPWEAPLPAWDYSHSEWPVLVGPNKQNSLTRRRVAIAAIALLACAAVFSFLVYRASTPERPTAPDAGTAKRVSAPAEPRASAAKPEDSDAHNRAPATAADTPASAPSKPAETVVREAHASNEHNNAQGRFSLQAAAFPTQSGADEFAEKLKRAGVPSYVAPVDLPRRGRWFRVRVGRFNEAEDAQRFAGEAQQRARAAGLSLQLIVCQYDQP